MRKLAALALVAPFLLVPVTAFAQDPDPAVAEAPPPPAAAEPPCRLVEHAGVPDADAHTATQLVCNAIARAGASPTSHYRVSLGKLGSVLILTVAHEGSTSGSTVDSREMRLQGIEEVDMAAPRIADAIVHGVPLVETEKVDNLTTAETRQPQSKPGKVHFALGLLGMATPPSEGFNPAPGLVFDVHYETGNQKLELGSSFRFTAGADHGTQSSHADSVMFSLGARYFPWDTDFSPYLGGGLSWEYLNLNASDFNGNGSGLGAYVDAGVEVLRTHHTHLALGLRCDLPFFSLNNEYGGYTAPGASTPASSYYYAPVSLELRLTF
jgi:hypothetical protein